MSQTAFDPKIAIAFQRGFAAGQNATQKTMVPFLQNIASLTEAVRELTIANQKILEKIEEDDKPEWDRGGDNQ